MKTQAKRAKHRRRERQREKESRMQRNAGHSIRATKKHGRGAGKWRNSGQPRRGGFKGFLERITHRQKKPSPGG